MLNAFVRSRITWRGLAFLALWGLLFATLLKSMNRRKKMNTINDTGRAVYLLLLEAGFYSRQAKFIMAQAAHETANFTSAVFLQNKNLFGYGFRGQQIAKGVKNGYANYETIKDSIQDFKNYYQRGKYPEVFTSIEEYVKALKKAGYYEADETEYLNGCKHFYKLYFE